MPDTDCRDAIATLHSQLINLAARSASLYYERRLFSHAVSRRDLELRSIRLAGDIRALNQYLGELQRNCAGSAPAPVQTTDADLLTNLLETLESALGEHLDAVTLQAWQTLLEHGLDPNHRLANPLHHERELK